MSRRNRIRKLVYEDAKPNFDIEDYGRGLAHRDYPDAAPRHIVHDVRLAYREWEADQITTTVCISDIHIPFHHRRAVANVFDFLEDLRPDNLVVNGDALDCYSISSFDQDFRRPAVQDEIEAGQRFFNVVNQLAPCVEFTLGNHEYRLQRALAKAGLHDLIDWTSLLDLEDRIPVTPYKEHVVVDGVYYTHGHRVRKHAGYTAKSMHLDEGYPRSVIGHVHRLARYSFTGASGQCFGIEAGGLFDIDQADYLTNPNWQPGFVVIESRQDKYQTRLVDVDPVDGSFWYEGNTYNTKTEWT